MGMLRRMTAATAIGEGLDGFDLGIIAVVLPLITADLGLTPVWSGLIAASTLVGIFFGSPIVGWLSDRIGRRTLFTIDIATFVVLGLLQAVVTEPWQLMVVRLLLGVAVGAEYALGAALLSEFAPADGRGRRLAGMLVTWYGGYLVSVVVAYALVEFGGFSWRWVLATSVVPALITLAARFGLPESPRWLMHRGRVDEARAIADRYLGGDDYFREEELDEQEHTKQARAGLKRLFEPGMRGRTLFVCTFYACNVAPYFAIFTFAPQVFAALQINNEAASTILANAIAVVGALVGMLTIERVGRRQQLIGPFWVMAAALLVVGLWASARRRDHRRLLRRVRVHQRPAGQPHRRLPGRGVPDGAAQHGYRLLHRLQPHRRRERHVPPAGRHLDHRDRALHVDRGGDLPDRRHGLPAHRRRRRPACRSAAPRRCARLPRNDPLPCLGFLVLCGVVDRWTKRRRQRLLDRRSAARPLSR